jgi:hypothetical protein
MDDAAPLSAGAIFCGLSGAVPGRSPIPVIRSRPGVSLGREGSGDSRPRAPASPRIMGPIPGIPPTEGRDYTLSRPGLREWRGHMAIRRIQGTIHPGAKSIG